MNGGQTNHGNTSPRSVNEFIIAMQEDVKQRRQSKQRKM